MPIPADLPIPRPVVGAMADIPIERYAVGAMAVPSTGPNDTFIFKPYVYRGTGEDIYDVVIVTTVEPPKPKKRRKRKTPKSLRPYVPRHRLHYAPELPHPPYAPRTGVKRKPLDIMDPETWGNWTRQPDPSPEAKPIRSAKGWQPMTGADIDSLLEGLDDDG